MPASSFGPKRPPIAGSTSRFVSPTMGLVLAAIGLCVLGRCQLAEAQRGRGRPIDRGGKKSEETVIPPEAVFSKFPDWVACVAFSADGRLVAAGSYGLVRLLDVHEKQEAALLKEPQGFVKSVAFTPDGRHLLCGSYQSISVWNLAERKIVRTLKGHRGYVTSIVISTANGLCASGSDDETVRFWNLESGEPIRTINDLSYPVMGLACSADGQLLAIATGDPTRPVKKGETRVVDASGHHKFTVAGHDRAVTCAAFSPDGALLATGSTDENIKLWSTADGSEVRSLEGHTRPVNSMVFLPDGKWLLSGSGGRAVGGNELRLWNVASGKSAVAVTGHDATILAVALAPDAAWFSTGGMDKTARLWKTDAFLKATAEKPAARQAKPDQPEPRPEPPPLPEEAAALARAALWARAEQQSPQGGQPIRVGIIGLDTSHSVAFTQILNDSAAMPDVANCRVVAAYPKGSPDIESSVSRVPMYTEAVVKMQVEIVDSIPALIDKCDAVLLETNDGRPHLEQALPVLQARKPVFVDKPIAGSLTDAVLIFEAARHYKTPVFSSSSLRYSSGAQAIRSGKIGEVKGCDAYSPCALEATHPDLFWYGIHGVETLFTVMGPGCESVTRVSTPGIDLAAGVWKGGRVGTFRGIRTEAGGGASGYGGTAFGTQGIQAIGPYEGYRPLLVEIVKFFRTGKPPVSEEETLEIYAFMEAADESKRQGGTPVKLSAVLEKARSDARDRMAALGLR